MATKGCGFVLLFDSCEYMRISREIFILELMQERHLHLGKKSFEEMIVALALFEYDLPQDDPIGPKLRELVSLTVVELCVKLKVWRNNRTDLADHFIQVCSEPPCAYGIC